MTTIEPTIPKNKSLSETTRTVFFPSLSTKNYFLFKTAVITSKGLHHILIQPPTTSFSLPLEKTHDRRLITMTSNNIMTQSQSLPPRPAVPPVPQGLTMEMEQQSVALHCPPISRIQEPAVIKKSKSSPIPSSTIARSTSIGRLKKPTLIDKLISRISSSTTTTTTNNNNSSNSTVRKAPRSSTSTKTASAANVSVKNNNSIKLTHKKPKNASPLPTPNNEQVTEQEKQEEEEEVPATRPISITERRKREAKRADQVKIWKVREEREAREQRSLMRKRLLNVVKSDPIIIRKKKTKKVKFELDKNSFIQLPSFLQDQ